MRPRRLEFRRGGGLPGPGERPPGIWGVSTTASLKLALQVPMQRVQLSPERCVSLLQAASRGAADFKARGPTSQRLRTLWWHVLRKQRAPLGPFSVAPSVAKSHNKGGPLRAALVVPPPVGAPARERPNPSLANRARSGSQTDASRCATLCLRRFSRHAGSAGASVAVRSDRRSPPVPSCRPHKTEPATGPPQRDPEPPKDAGCRSRGE